MELNAKLLTEVMVQPATLVVPTDKAAGHEITVTDLRTRPLTITEVRTTSSRLKPRLHEPARDQAGHWQRKISLAVDPDYPEGRREETLYIYTDDPQYPEFRVSITLVKRPKQRVTATPGEATITGSPGQPLPHASSCCATRRTKR